jgi:hypothetical protein
MPRKRQHKYAGLNQADVIALAEGILPGRAGDESDAELYRIAGWLLRELIEIAKRAEQPRVGRKSRSSQSPRR